MKYLAALILLGALGFGQSKQKVIIDNGPPDAYLFPPEQKAELRDLQYQGDQLEIQNQKLLMQIEQNKEKQNALIDQMKEVAFEYAQKRKIDLSLYELDPVQMKFAKKKK